MEENFDILHYYEKRTEKFVSAARSFNKGLATRLVDTIALDAKLSLEYPEIKDKIFDPLLSLYMFVSAVDLIKREQKLRTTMAVSMVLNRNSEIISRHLRSFEDSLKSAKEEVKDDKCKSIIWELLSLGKETELFLAIESFLAKPKKKG